VQLDAEEGRVIGSLIEKQLTTPQQYPLTLNSLVLACNQSSNRDPVVSYDERTVEQTLTALKTAGLVRFVHPSHGRSVIRYRQVLDERLALDETELALVGVLLLRGPQTVGELRIRTERMATFDGITGVETELGRLLAQPEPLVARLPRRPGQKEERWIQLLAAVAVNGEVGDNERPASVAAATSTADGRTWRPGPLPEGSLRPQPFEAAEPAAASRLSSPGGSWAPTAPDQPAEADHPPRPSLEALAQEVAELRAEVIRLRDAFEHLREQLGG
jgi:uncharacterized protein YceH (UPF0502 family)